MNYLNKNLEGTSPNGFKEAVIHPTHQIEKSKKFEKLEKSNHVPSCQVSQKYVKDSYAILCLLVSIISFESEAFKRDLVYNIPC